MQFKKTMPIVAKNVVHLVHMYSISVDSLLHGKLLHHRMAEWSEEEYISLINDVYAKDADDEVLQWLEEGEKFVVDKKHLKEISSIKAGVYLKVGFFLSSLHFNNNDFFNFFTEKMV